MRQIPSGGEPDTEAAGAMLAGMLRPGDIVTFRGGMGAGKTVFTRGVARALGFDAALVTSPTFALLNEYRGGRLALCHIDAFRLSHGVDLSELGLYDYLDRGWAALIEWGEHLPDLVADFTVIMEHTGGDNRLIIIRGRGI